MLWLRARTHIGTLVKMALSVVVVRCVVLHVVGCTVQTQARVAGHSRAVGIPKLACPQRNHGVRTRRVAAA